MNASPGNRKVSVFASPAEVAREGARILLEVANLGGTPAVALSGGSTPKAMYECLRNMDSKDTQALRNAHYFFGDERTVDNYHSDSNVCLAMTDFLSPLKVPYHMIEAPDGAASDLDAEASRLTHRMHDYLPHDASGVPVFDLIFLGMGQDGHTASLFPETAALNNQNPAFVANHVLQLNTWRLTLTFPVLNAARHIVILCTGASKAAVLQHIFTGSEERYPIQRIAASRVSWLLDSAAAAPLPKGFAEMVGLE